MGPNDSVTGSVSQAEVREALDELPRYFSDELAPLMVSESVETLMRCPPDFAVTAIRGWVATQGSRPGSDATVGDYLFHALKKLHQMIEYELIDDKKMTAFLRLVSQQVLPLCPEHERATLEQNLGRLGDVTRAGPVASVGILHRQPGSRGGPSPGAGGAPVGASGPSASVMPAAPPITMPSIPSLPLPEGGESVELARGLRRLTVMLRHLGRAVGGAERAEATTAGEPRMSSYALATAAAHSRDTREFARYLEQLEEIGVEGGMPEVFRTLGQAVPGWTVGDDAPAPASSSERAMQHIMSMAEQSGEGLQRTTDIVQAAVTHFNDGALVQAAKMLALARQSLQRMKLDPEVVGGILRRSQDTLSADRLRQFAERPEKHGLLSQVMSLFPAYTVDGLLDAVAVEERRDQRRMMLALLEAHGQATRRAALDRLQACADGRLEDAFGYFQRNLVFLLRRIPPADDDTREIEIGYYGELSSLHYPMLLVREAIGALSQLKSPAVERVLITRLEQVEQALGEKTEIDTANELRALLDRIAAGLARQQSTSANRAVVKHAFQRRPVLGNALARVAELSGNDLSDDSEIVDLLLRALKREVPMKVLGFVMPKNQSSIVQLSRALAGTPTADVKAMLQRIASGFPEQEFGREAAAILSGFDASGLPEKKSRRETHRGLAGDVELFGLPNLLQSLADSSVTGRLTLRNEHDEQFATVEIRDGRVQGCANGRLQGEDAFYQLFETPVPGTFEFQPSDPPPQATDQPPMLDVQSGLLEALRRYDEFQMARAVAPDDVELRPTGQKPTSMEGESDVEFLRGIWAQAAKGISPAACEQSVPVDTYRVRRLYAHWLESGALQPVNG
ncbi:MAG TPA: DUF4388 domain-containing protein [Candidatus Polarisedimenticolaceae bacterium]|nr:DUF4388 domain-containing protein [Candidatus Polarisedimenticolaceae bacterium]